jgi:hypothetical protein
VFGTLAYVFAPQVIGYPTFSFNEYRLSRLCMNHNFDGSIDDYQAYTISLLK